MKRLLTLLTLVLCSCAETFVGEEIAKPNSENLPDLTAAFAEEDATRTYIENGKYLRWNEDDRLTIFFGNTLNRQYKFNGQTGDNSGTFSLVADGMLGTGNAFDHIYALYPYNADARITDEGVISLTLPETQTYAENSFGLGANTMVAVTENLEDTFLAFKNVGGYLKLKLYNAEGATIKSIEVKGNNGEKLAGEATLSINFGETPILTMADAATDTVVLDCGNGVALGTTAETATEFWVVLPATTFAEGLTITATDTEGGVFEKSTTNEVVIERNAIQPMAALEAECTPPGPADNEIWYTNGSITEPTNPNSMNVFGNGASLVSNIYDAEKECWVITFDKKITAIGDRAFYGCTLLTSIILPKSITRIASEAFYCCSGLTNILIPNSVTEIGYQAFLSCDSLTDITIPDSVTIIEQSAFAGCNNLKNVVVGNGVKTIGYSAFASCEKLETIVLGNSLEYIRQEAFYQCKSLKEIRIPDSFKSMDSRVFNGCSSLAKISGKNTSDDERCYIANGTLYAFAPAGITSYIIPDEVTTIGYSAFWLCDKLGSVTIGSNVTKISDKAFFGCDELIAVYCTSYTPPTIGSYVFQYQRLKIYVPISALYSYQTAWSSYSVVGIDTSKINTLNYTTTDGEIAQTNLLVISNTYKDGVGEIVFYGTAIADGAFKGCNNLSSVTLFDGVASIGQVAFRDCSNLISVTLPSSVVSIESGAFMGCSNLANITIPNNVQTIGASAFIDCTSLMELIIPDSATELGSMMLQGCTNLNRVVIGNQVASIPSSMCQACTNLTDVTIGEAVSSIESYAFAYCENLSNITIPKSVTEIYYWAFYGCNSLVSVYCKPTTPPIAIDEEDDGWKAFDKNGENRKIYVPANRLNSYKTASWWIRYSDYIVGYNFETGEESDGSEIPEGTYSVVLNNAWRQSTSVSNPDSSLYDGVYESYSNYNVNDGVATMYIDIDGYSEFSIYVRSNAESSYDYVTVSELDSSTVKRSTSGNQNSGTAISNYTKVTYTGIDGGKHRITVIYKKDYSQHSGTDRGYLIIPKNQ